MSTLSRIESDATYNVNKDSPNNALIDIEDDKIVKRSVPLVSRVDVLGVASSTNGHMRNQHECCGNHFGVRDFLNCSRELHFIVSHLFLFPFRIHPS
jgi:hypothetical protein